MRSITALIISTLALYTVAVPTDFSDALRGLFQGKSGTQTLGDKCKSETECKGSLTCFRKVESRHGRCAFKVATLGKECNVEGSVDSQNRCDFGLVCISQVCVKVLNYNAASTPAMGLGEPCYLKAVVNEDYAKVAARSQKAAPGYAVRPPNGFPCGPELGCKVNELDVLGMGRCFPFGGKPYKPQTINPSDYRSTATLNPSDPRAYFGSTSINPSNPSAYRGTTSVKPTN